jgi:hypothetical protein
MRRFVVALAPLISVVGAGVPALAQQDEETAWEEPSLEEALGQANFVVRAHVDPKSSSASPAILVDKVLGGETQEGARLVVTGTSNAVAEKYLGLVPLKAGEEGFFILHEVRDAEGQNPRLTLPTATFGRFPIHDAKVTACFRDSFVRVDVKPEEFATFLKNAFAKTKGQKPDAGWLDEQRETLKKLDATSGASADAAHVALESLCYGATPADAELGLRFFGSPRFQVRVSAARLLEHAGGERAADGLLRLATQDEDPAVRSVATSALVRVKPRPKDAVKSLLAHLHDASAATISLHSSIDDPRTNEITSPLAAGFDALRDLDAGSEATPLALELLGKDDADTVSTACVHLVTVKPAPPLAAIVDRMRPKGYPYSGLNEFIANALNHLAGTSLPPDKDQWRAWLAGQKDEK